MGSAFSILGVLFALGALLFIIMMIFAMSSLKGGVGLGGRPIVTALMFAFAIALMAGPAMTLAMGGTYAAEHAFRMFFGKPAPETVRIVQNQSGGGGDYSNLMLEIEFSSKAEFEAFAASARLERSGLEAAPDAKQSEMPGWWTPNDCAGALSVYTKDADANWNRKWATFCDTDNRAFAFAAWMN